MEVTLANREPVGETDDAVAVDDALGNQAHRAADEVTAHVPLG